MDYTDRNRHTNTTKMINLINILKILHKYLRRNATDKIICYTLKI